MQDDVKLASVEFSNVEDSMFLASVKVSLSDGSSSPNFGYEIPQLFHDNMYYGREYQMYNHKVIPFDKDEAIR